MIINEVNFLEELKKRYPHLYDFQMEIERVINTTGYGDVSVSCIIRYKKVFSSDVIGAVKSLYDKEDYKKEDKA